MTRTLLAGALVMTLASSAPAATWLVEPDGSGDFPTIQAALDDASSGDEILLGDGTFTGAGNRDLRFLGKELTVRSASGDVAACVIDCENTAHAFRFLGDEGPLAVLRDVTLTRCQGAAVDMSDASPTIRNVAVQDCRRGFYGNGGSPTLDGVTCRDGETPTIELRAGAPLLTDCVLEANTLVNSRGALELYGSTATLERCTIRDYDFGDYSFAPGVWVSSGDVTMRDCEISDNSTYAIWLYGSSPSTLTLENCVLENNQGEALRFSTPYNGPQGTLVLRDCVLRSDASSDIGIRVSGKTDTVLERCTIEGFLYGVWGNVPSIHSALNLTVRDCLVRNNSTYGIYSNLPNLEIVGGELRGNGRSGAFLHGDGQVDIRNCLITGNGDHGLELRDFAGATLERCTIASNGGADPGGGIEIVSPAGALRFHRTIVWGNCSSDGSEIQVPAGGSVELDCVNLDVNAIQGGGSVVIAGEVLATDPMFCAPARCGITTEGIYTLAWVSPASMAVCGPIGALGAGCEAPTSARSGVEVRSWGSIKSLYR